MELIKNNDPSVRSFHSCFLEKIIGICFKIGVDKHLGLYGRKLKSDDEPYTGWSKSRWTVNDNIYFEITYTAKTANGQPAWLKLTT